MSGVQFSCALLITIVFFTCIHTGSTIICYECNSHNDSRCANEKLPDTLKKDCSEHVRGIQYTMCRKIVQNIDFEVNGNMPDSRVIRSCGFDETSYKGRCYQRSGFGGRQEVCSCLMDLCNDASHNKQVSVFLGTAVSLLLVLALY